MSHNSTTKSEKTGIVTNPEVDRAAMEKLVIARIGMLMHNPFFGNIATRLILKNGDSWLPTAATEGKHIFYNSEFVNSLREKEVVFLVGHELFHVLYDHCGIGGRCGNRNPQLWNIATDYAINGDLVNYRIGEKITTVPTLHDKKYDGMSAEQIYEDLYQNAEKINIDQLAKMVLDEHIDGDDSDGSGNGKPKLSEEERAALNDEIKEAILSAAQAVGASNVPAGFKRFIFDMTEPKMNWREILQQQIESQIKNDFHWAKPSRRGWSVDAILPSMKREPAVETTIAIDMSGSISEQMIKDFLGEVKGIMDQHASYRIDVMCFDTNIYNHKVFTEDNGDELLEYEPQGGGGTMFECVFDYLKENELQPKQLVIMTDMYPNATWGDEDYCENTVFLAHHSDIEAPFGITVKYD